MQQIRKEKKKVIAYIKYLKSAQIRHIEKSIPINN